MKKIKTVYQENIFIKGKIISNLKYMISFYIEVIEKESEFNIHIIEDEEYYKVLDRYDLIFDTYSYELHELISEHTKELNELVGYRLNEIKKYQPQIKVYTGF